MTGHPPQCPCDGCAGRGFHGTRDEVDELLADIARQFPPERPGGTADTGSYDPALDPALGEMKADEMSRRFGPGAMAATVAHWLRTGEIWPDRHGQKALVADTSGAIILPTDYAADIATVARETGTIRALCGTGVRPTRNIRHRAGLLSAATTGWGRLETGTAVTDAAVAVSSPALDIDVHDVLALALIGTDELDDTPEAARAAITEAIGIALGEAQDAVYANGTGTGQPKGLALAANVTRVPAGQKVAAGASATPTAADLASIPPKLPVKYRRGAVWLASTDMYAKILALLFPAATLATSAGPQAGPLNYPMYEVPGLPSAATAGTTDASVWFINVPLAYRIADRQQVTVTRLTQRYIDQGYIGMLVRARTGADLVRPDACCVYTL